MTGTTFPPAFTRIGAQASPAERPGAELRKGLRL